MPGAARKDCHPELWDKEQASTKKTGGEEVTGWFVPAHSDVHCGGEKGEGCKTGGAMS